MLSFMTFPSNCNSLQILEHIGSTLSQSVYELQQKLSGLTSILLLSSPTIVRSITGNKNVHNSINTPKSCQQLSYFDTAQWVAHASKISWMRNLLGSHESTQKNILHIDFSPFLVSCKSITFILFIFQVRHPNLFFCELGIFRDKLQFFLKWRKNQ